MLRTRNWLHGLLVITALGLGGNSGSLGLLLLTLLAHAPLLGVHELLPEESNNVGLLLGLGDGTRLDVSGLGGQRNDLLALVLNSLVQLLLGGAGLDGLLAAGPDDQLSLVGLEAVNVGCESEGDGEWVYRELVLMCVVW